MNEQIKIIRECLEAVRNDYWGLMSALNSIEKLTASHPERMQNSIKYNDMDSKVQQINKALTVLAQLEQPTVNDDLIEKLRLVKKETSYFSTAKDVIDEAIKALSQVKPSVVWKKYPDEKPQVPKNNVWVRVVYEYEITEMPSLTRIQVSSCYYYHEHNQFETIEKERHGLKVKILRWCYEADLISTIKE
jgi:hypothetical protein